MHCNMQCLSKSFFGRRLYMSMPREEALYFLTEIRRGNFDGLFDNYVRVAAQRANLDLEEIGTSEHELKQFKRSREKKRAQGLLQQARELYLESHNFHCIAGCVEAVGATLEEIGTSEQELKVLLGKRIVLEWEYYARLNMGERAWVTFCFLRDGVESRDIIPQLIQRYRELPNQYFRMYVWEFISLLRKKFPTDVQLQEFLQQEISDPTFGKVASLVLQGQELEVRSIEGTPSGLTDRMSLCPKRRNV